MAFDEYFSRRGKNEERLNHDCVGGLGLVSLILGPWRRAKTCTFSEIKRLIDSIYKIIMPLKVRSLSPANSQLPQ